MALKNLFGRGIGFGAVHWIVTRGYSSGAVVLPDTILLGTFSDPTAAVTVRAPVAECSISDPTGAVTMRNPFVVPTISAPEAS